MLNYYLKQLMKYKIAGAIVFLALALTGSLYKETYLIAALVFLIGYIGVIVVSELRKNDQK